MSDVDRLVGVTFARRWRVERPLAAGGMGAVYVASDLTSSDARTPQRVALKVIKSARTADDQLVARFRREMSALAAVRHDNVVAFLDSGVEEQRTPDGQRDDALYLVMELLDGRSLRAVCRDAPGHRVDWPRAFALIADVCAGLGALHDAGIIHRDLKPENVLVTMQGAVQGGTGVPPVTKRQRAVLIDLGIVRLVDTVDSALVDVTGAMTQTGFVVGTPGYIAPEQLCGQPASPASDVYAAGVMLFELVTGRPPYDGNDLEELLRKQALGDALRARAVAPWLPEHVDALLARMLARVPAQRVATAHEAHALLVDALDAQAPTETFTATALPALTPTTPHATMMPAIPPLTLPLTMSATSTIPMNATMSHAPIAPPPTATSTRTVVALAVAISFAALVVVGGVVMPASRDEARDAGDARGVDVGVDGGAVVDEPRAALGMLHVEATPAANVIVDDVPRGRTPFDVELTPGPHVVKLVGAITREHTVDIVGGETVRLVDEMRAPHASRTISASTLRALAQRRAADLAPCGRPALEASARITALPGGRVQVVVDGPRAACVMARTVRWQVDPFEGEPVTTRVDVVLGE